MSLDLDKSTWKRVALGDVAAASKEKWDQASDPVDRYIAGEHMDTDDLKIRRWGRVGDGYLGPAFHRRFRPGQVLYGSRRTYLRKVAVAEFGGVCANTTFVVDSLDETVLLREFLPWVMTSEPFHAFAIGESKGSVNPYVNWSDIARFEFDLPPLDEQQRIADLLWSLERHGGELRKVAADCGRLSEVAFMHMLARADVPLVPATKLIDDVTVGVVVKPTQYYTTDPDGIPALRGLNVLPGGFELAEMVRFTAQSAKALAKSTVRVGDVVIVRTGRPGDAAVVTEEIDGFNCIDLIIVRPGKQLSSHFLAWYLNSEVGGSQVGKHSAGTAQQHFNVGALKKLKLPALSVDEQNRIVSTVTAVRDAQRVVEAEIAALRSLMRTTSTQVFGGER